MLAPICPFLTEKIWQEMRKNKIVTEESIHFCEWPKFNGKKIDEKSESEFEIILKIIEAGLAERDNARIGLRWPLASAEVTIENKVFGKESFSEELKEIIARQLNVKKIEVKKEDGAGIKVVLDARLTPDLEAEGYAREFARKIQAERKKMNLEKQDVINLKIYSDNEIKKLLMKQEKFLKERTNAKLIEFSIEKTKRGISIEIKNKKIYAEIENLRR